MLYTGALFSQRVKFIGGGAVSVGRGANRALSRTSWPNFSMSLGGVDAKTSIPDGMRGGVALMMARSDGGMVARLTGGGLCDVLNLTATGNIESDLTSTGTIGYANLAGGINISSTITGGATLDSTDLRGKARLVCNISIGAQPSADDIAEAVIGKIITGSTQPNTVADALKKTLKRDEFLGLS